ncbi:MAG TPA: glycosyltransferase family 4 protein [Verrucomicrobiae bacterium]|jgi:glycosyltransferase involved in cell wall biosynthesis
MRVTHVITRLIIGGAQENTIATVLGLQQCPGLQVNLVSGLSTGPEGSLESCFAAKPELLTVLPSLVRPVHPWLDAMAWRQLTRMFRAEAPRIVHTHSGKAGVLARLAARRAGVPVIIHTVHGPSFGPFQGAISNLVFRAAERHTAKATTHFISVADAMTRQYLAAGIGRPEQFTRIFSGFALEPFLAARPDPALRASLGIAPDDFVVGKIARLFKLKGHGGLISAAPEIIRRHPRSKFLLVGGGAWQERLRERARAEGLENNFIFAGLIPPAEIPRYIGIMDVVAHLSRREGLPRALSQALAAGKPVVAFDSDGANEVCFSGQTGFLIPVGDIQSLAGRLAQLAADPALRERLGRQGQELARANFSVESMVEKIRALYEKLTEPK